MIWKVDHSFNKLYTGSLFWNVTEHLALVQPASSSAFSHHLLGRLSRHPSDREETRVAR